MESTTGNYSREELLRRFMLAKQPPDAPKPVSVMWFEQGICGLAKDGYKRLKELKKESRALGSHIDKKQLNYLQQLQDMKLTVPAFYRKQQDPKLLFRNLKRFCADNDIPDELALRLIPHFMAYIRTGHMKPILLVGNPGCGKTTALKLLTEFVLQIPVEKIDVTLVSSSHGISGDSGIYQSATCGMLAQAMLKNNNLISAFIFDEIDKAKQTSEQSSIDVQLLPLTDKSGGTIYDQYLENTMTSLKYCPIFFTGNVLSNISEALKDRLDIICFPSADNQRIESILHKYAKKQFNEFDYARYIRLDEHLLDDYIVDLADKHNIRSLRRHEDMLDSALYKAYLVAMNKDDDAIVDVNRDMFEAAEKEAIAASLKQSSGRQIGFSWY